MSRKRFCVRCRKLIARNGKHKTCVQCDMDRIAASIRASGGAGSTPTAKDASPHRFTRRGGALCDVCSRPAEAAAHNAPAVIPQEADK